MCMCGYVYVYVCVCMSMSMCICVYVYMCICVFVFVFVFVFVGVILMFYINACIRVFILIPLRILYIFSSDSGCLLSMVFFLVTIQFNSIFYSYHHFMVISEFRNKIPISQ
jgi:hypothetical protein